MARRAPLAVGVRAGGALGAANAPAPAQPRGRHHVVHVQADAHQEVRPGPVEGGHDHFQRRDQVGREPDQKPALEQGLTDESEVELLQVPQTPVHELG
jgi:hypothetical protein